MKAFGLVLALLLITPPAFADIARIKDKTGKTTGYLVTDESTGVTRIKDRTWQTTGYISEGRITDRQGNVTARIE